MNEPDSLVDLRNRYLLGVGETTRQILDEGRTLEKIEELAIVAGRYSDSETNAWRLRPDAPEGIACRLGCSYCCRVPVGVTIPEAILIGSMLLDESTEEELAEVLNRTRTAEDARLGLVGPERDRVLHPCPMLDEHEKTCTIHEFRPLNCRGWNSLDVSRCEALHDDPARGLMIPIDGVQRTISLAIASGLQGGLESRGMEHATVDLVIALRIILEDPSAIDRWLAGAPAFLDAEVADLGP